ncbi:bidirectional sugar transporter SWEET6a-like [Phoenix dactylifera]|uniref:Bidirectional sugar transporter SWEET n=1 Tax=Phoenix dactylifera TaxID=42345 RepID=A0A8B9A667_PHODC|nr:bidirectional sugar transporter SWEET6a-like [Phoenix dactylifera]
MVSAENARQAVGVVGNVLSFGLFLAPVPTFATIWKRKTVEDFSPLPYLVTLLNCMLWVFYGLPVVHPGTILVSTINGVGVVLETIYLCIFFFYSPNRLRLRVLKLLAFELVSMAGVVIGVILGAHTHSKRQVIVGVLSVVLCTAMYASPLFILRLVISTKSVEYLPFYLCLAGLFNGACWTTYALIRFDIFLLIPNGLGALLGAVQVLIYFYYHHSTSKAPSKGDLPAAAA